MSTYEPEFDTPLLAAPWQALPSSSRLILKYTAHPSRPGYIVLLTDLASVYCEVLTGPSIPSRLKEVDREFGTKVGRSKNGAKGKKKKTEVDDDDVIGISEAALADLEEMWIGLEDAKVEMRDHQFHDATLSVQTNDFSWLFYLTELKGRQPLDILSKHLIAPLAGILIETNHIKTTGQSDPIGLVHSLFQQSPTITQHMTHHHVSSSESTRSGQATSSKAETSKKNTISPYKGKARAAPSPAPKAAQKLDEENEVEEEEYVSDKETAPPAQTRSLDTPKKDIPKSKSNGDKGPTSKRDNTSRNSAEVSAPSPTSPPVSPSPKKKNAKPVVPSDSEEMEVDEAEEADVGSEAESEKKEKSITPPPPTASSQSKKDRERAEEEEMLERAEKMKRKMEAGGAGAGNLGRRRLRR